MRYHCSKLAEKSENIWNEEIRDNGQWTVDNGQLAVNKGLGKEGVRETEQPIVTGRRDDGGDWEDWETGVRKIIEVTP